MRERRWDWLEGPQGLGVKAHVEQGNGGSWRVRLNLKNTKLKYGPWTSIWDLSKKCKFLGPAPDLLKRKPGVGPSNQYIHKPSCAPTYCMLRVCKALLRATGSG